MGETLPPCIPGDHFERAKASKEAQCRGDKESTAAPPRRRVAKRRCQEPTLFICSLLYSLGSRPSPMLLFCWRRHYALPSSVRDIRLAWGAPAFSSTGIHITFSWVPAQSGSIDCHFRQRLPVSAMKHFSRLTPSPRVRDCPESRLGAPAAYNALSTCGAFGAFQIPTV